MILLYNTSSCGNEFLIYGYGIFPPSCLGLWTFCILPHKHHLQINQLYKWPEQKKIGLNTNQFKNRYRKQNSISNMQRKHKSLTKKFVTMATQIPVVSQRVTIKLHLTLSYQIRTLKNLNSNTLPIRSGVTCSRSSSSVGCLASGAGVWVGLLLRMSFWRPYTDCENHQNNLQPYLHKFKTGSDIREEISVWLHQSLGISHGQLRDCWGEPFWIGRILWLVDWFKTDLVFWLAQWMIDSSNANAQWYNEWNNCFSD